MKRLGVLVVLLLAGCATVPVVAPADPEPVPDVVVDYSGLASEFGGTGSWDVGVDVQPGTYVAEYELDTCKWFQGEGGDLKSWGESFVVVLEVGETIEVEGCSMWVLVP